MSYGMEFAKSDVIGDSHFSGEGESLFNEGDWAYLDDPTGTMKYADNFTEEAADVYGVCQAPSRGTDMPLTIIRSGPITIRGDDVFPGPGVILFLGNASELLFRYSELASSAWITVLGYSTGLRTMMIDIRVTGQQKP